MELSQLPICHPDTKEETALEALCKLLATPAHRPRAAQDADPDQVQGVPSELCRSGEGAHGERKRRKIITDANDNAPVSVTHVPSTATPDDGKGRREEFLRQLRRCRRQGFMDNTETARHYELAKEYTPGEIASSESRAAPFMFKPPSEAVAQRLDSIYDKETGQFDGVRSIEPSFWEYEMQRGDRGAAVKSQGARFCAPILAALAGVMDLHNAGIEPMHLNCD